MLKYLKDGIPIVRELLEKTPVMEQNIVIDNEYFIDKEFNKPRKYNNLNHYVHNRTTISNKSSQNMVINEASLYIKNLKRHYFEDVVVNYGLNKQHILIFGINNGNKRSEDAVLKIESYAQVNGGTQKTIDLFEVVFCKTFLHKIADK